MRNALKYRPTRPTDGDTYRAKDDDFRFRFVIGNVCWNVRYTHSCCCTAVFSTTLSGWLSISGALYRSPQQSLEIEPSVRRPSVSVVVVLITKHVVVAVMVGVRGIHRRIRTTPVAGPRTSAGGACPAAHQPFLALRLFRGVRGRQARTRRA